MGCFLGRQQRAEIEPLLQGRLGLANFRNGRDEANSTRDRRCIKWTVKGMARTLGIWDPSGCGVMLSFLMALISLFQLAYDLFVVCGCPGFDCGYLQKHGNHQKQKPFRKTSNTMYTLASMGGFFSFTLLLICLLLVKRRRKLYDYKALVPPDVLDHDLSNRHLNVMSGTVALTVVLFSGSVGLFYYIVHSEPKNTYFYWLVTGVASQFLSQWAAIVACHLFAICCCSMGK
ncbi:uncharacterized protein LOC116604349 [Nematostella vectensis]|uniref:uncharacterized protein LOC116604349 n=1 Tax=Nematostella vectensis TaxID=45351 RepID=UPI00207716CF|nr:uncharacterized protein LOC116604349 [Nematostella vectensis]